MRAITLRFPRGGSGLPARIGSALARPSAKLREWGGLIATLPALTRAEMLLAARPVSGLPKRRLRIPDCALISVTAGPAPSPLLLAAPEASANDNGTASAPAAGRSRVSRRDLVFLAMLMVSLAGAYWQGRMQGYQKIISVPGPSLPGSKVT